MACGTCFVAGKKVLSQARGLCFRARWRDCYSDEHYFATLLAAEGRDAETDCHGYAVHVDWSRMGEHPRAYEPREITSARRAVSSNPTF